MRRIAPWVKVLVCTNVTTIVFLSIVSFHYKVPQKVLNKVGIIKFETVGNYPNYDANNIASLTYEREGFDVVMLGDSITDLVNWNELLHNKRIANFGIGGDSTDGVIHRLSDVYVLNPKQCFIMIGINDFQGNRSVDYVINNYKTIVSEIKQHNIEVIIQSTLYLGDMYYITHVLGKTKKDWEITNAKVKLLNEQLQILAKDEGVYFLDLNSELSPNDILDKKYADESGLHLSTMGHEKWCEIIEPLMKTNKEAV